MPHYHSLDELHIRNAWLTIGVFDGVHRGHMELLARLVSGAHAQGAPAAVLTFHPHPAVVLGGKADLPCLTPPDERANLLESLGVDAVITQEFTREFASQTAEVFMQRLVNTLGLRQLVIGYDTALGRGREGNAARLEEIGRKLGYQVERIPPLKDETGILSSARIRQEIAGGGVEAAAAGLGRRYAVNGPVVHGDGRGRTLDFPTANIAVPPGKLLPANGIYATWAWVEERRFGSVTSIGVRPTFEYAVPTRKVETYLLDFDEDVYGKQMKIEFVSRLRDELKFPSAAALVEQIRLDVEISRTILAERGK